MSKRRVPPRLYQQFDNKYEGGYWGVAMLRGLRSPARKTRLVVDLVRGKPAIEALAILKHTPRGVAPDVLRVLKSAVSNALMHAEAEKVSLREDELFVHTAFVDEGPTMKRFLPRAMGKAGRIRKRSSQVTMFVVSRNAELVKE